MGVCHPGETRESHYFIIACRVPYLTKFAEAVSGPRFYLNSRAQISQSVTSQPHSKATSRKSLLPSGRSGVPLYYIRRREEGV